MKDSLSTRYIAYKRMLSLMDRRSASGRPVPFDVTFVRRKDGVVESYRGCWLTSRHSSGGTVNVMCPSLNAPRKIRLCLILTFNNLKVYR